MHIGRTIELVDYRLGIMDFSARAFDSTRIIRLQGTSYSKPIVFHVVVGGKEIEETWVKTEVRDVLGRGVLGVGHNSHHGGENSGNKKLHDAN